MLKFTHMIHAIDSHTAGEPTRIVTSGLPVVIGANMAEKWHYAQVHMNHLRRLLMLEPRGHSDMFGAILTAPCDPQADYGLLFCDSGGWLPMCGHGTIGTATSLLQAGMIPAVRPETVIRFDTPAGLVEVHVQIEDDGSAHTAWFQNVPSFVYASDLDLTVPGVGNLKVDIAFGGNFFLIVPVKQLGLSVTMTHARRLVDLGLVILKTANERFAVRHPTESHLCDIGLVEFTEPGVQGADYRNIVVFGDGNFDRSPCGTGTCARMAELYAAGKLEINQPFVHESVLGTRFQGILVGETRVGPFPGVIPRVSGSAYITGFNMLVLDPDDPLPTGFNIMSDMDTSS